MTQWTRATMLVTGCSIVLAIGSAGQAATPAKLVGADLKPRDVNVQMLRDGVLTFFDNQRNLQAEPASRFLQLRFAAPSSATPSADGASSVIELIDGQRLVGQLAHVSGDGQTLQWEHPHLGLVMVPLDQVAAWSRGSELAFEPTPAADRVELLNGDVVSGFVEKLADQQVHLKPQGDAAMLTLPLSNVKSLRLANPRQEAAAQGVTLWLGDGSRLRAQAVTVLDDQFTLVEPVLAMTPRALPAERVRRLDLAGDARRLVDLADLPFNLVSGGKVFGVASPPRREGTDLALQAPVTLTWALPSGARRLSAVLSLTRDADANSAMRAWADCRAVLRLDDRVVAEQRLWSQQPSVEVNVPLRGRVLTLELDPGVNGPVMDRVVVEGAVVLISE